MYAIKSIQFYIYTGIFVVLMFFVHSARPVLASGENLITNPDLEITDNTGLPQDWIKGRWGTNTTVFEYPVLGVNSSKAARVSISSYSSGDAKWKFADLAVTPGHEYQFSDFYTSDISSYITIQFKKSDGTFSYKDIGHPGPARDFQKFTATFIVPANTETLSIFHLLNAVGTLTTDEFELKDITALPPPPPDSNNLISNPSFEYSNGAGTSPVKWSKGNWGSNTSTFIFPISGYQSSNAAEIQMNAYSSGDAKWYFDEVPVNPGEAYSFSDFYKSNTKTYITVRFKQTDGTFKFLDIGTVEASTDWQTFSSTFTVAANTVSLTIFHLLKNNGTLAVDAYSLKKIESDPSKFSTGMVSIHFDDGWRSAYENAVPILNAQGFKSTNFIVSGRLNPNYPGYIQSPELLALQAQGHEIGAHTRTHPDLTTLSTSQMQNEIVGSRNDLTDIGITPVNFFAYPYGAYNTQTKSVVQNAGFSAARSSDGGYNLKTQDLSALRRQSMTSNTTFAQAKNYIDTAMNDKTWVILLFHEVNYTGNQYSVSPELFQEIVDYLASKDITPVTLGQGVALMQ